MHKERTDAARVLLVDDVADLRQMFRLMLTQDGRFDVVGEAADGVEAIEKARELRPDLILLDIAMPRMDGLEAIPRLHEAAPGTRILVLSGFDTAKIAQQAVALCATAFLEKGASSKDITDTAHRVRLSPPKRPCAVPPIAS